MILFLFDIATYFNLIQREKQIRTERESDRGGHLCFLTLEMFCSICTITNEFYSTRNSDKLQDKVNKKTI